jgi:DNA-binding MarR family transcriptional regulator
MAGRASHDELAADVWRQVFSLFWARQPRMLEMAQELGITPGHVKALLELRPDLPRSMGALAELLRCDASNATWLVDRLEERGLVERRPLPGDRRVKTIVLTELGAKTRAQIIEGMYEPPDDLLTLDRESLETLREVLARLPEREPPFGMLAASGGGSA